MSSLREILAHRLEELRTECDQLEDLIETGDPDDKTIPGLRFRLGGAEGARDAVAMVLELWDEPARWEAHRDDARREEQAACTPQNREYWAAAGAVWSNMITQVGGVGP